MAGLATRMWKPSACCAEGIADVGSLLDQAWQRYKIPLVITEVHLGCTREEQMRWFCEIWRTAKERHDAGLEIRAVTAWTLLGSFDWNSLVTRLNGHYEPGVFDLRSDCGPRPTALANLLPELVAGREPVHPVLASPGWWHLPKRLGYPAFSTGGRAPRHRKRIIRPVLISGATGTLGRALGHICVQRGLACRLLNRHEMDIGDASSVDRAIAAWQPWAIVNAAGYVRVDDAEREPELCYRENALGPAILARACRQHNLKLVTFSSDLVFDGRHEDLYRESDPVAPLNVYGMSKAEAEKRVLDHFPEALIVRTSAFFGPWDQYNFVAAVINTLRAGQPFRAAEDMIVSPTYVPDLVNATLDLLIDDAHGIWHLANAGALSWADLARRTAQLGAFDPNQIVGCRAAELHLPAPRPAFTRLRKRTWPDSTGY